MIEVARTQDEETGDGTKSVIILGRQPYILFYPLIPFIQIIQALLKLVYIKN